MKRQKIALTGRLRVGKDYIAAQCQGATIGFADPLYVLGEYLTGLDVAHKDTVPFLRELYQKLGQWGRGEISDKYPLSMERCLFTSWVKTSGVPEKILPYVDWSMWGRGGSIWLDALLRRSDELLDNRVFVSNCRFQNEYKALVDSGWDLWHVLCSRQTYEERLRGVNMSINDPKISDISEQLAAQLDNAVVNMIKAEPVGPKLKVIWNDNRPSPCDRLQTLEQFQAYLTNQEIEPEYTYGDEATEQPADSTPNTADGAGDDPEHSEDARAERQQDRDPSERRRARKAVPGA